MVNTARGDLGVQPLKKCFIQKQILDAANSRKDINNGYRNVAINENIIQANES